MNQQHKIESLKRRYGKHGAPEVRGPRMAAVGKGMPKNSRQTIRRLMHYLNEDKAKMTLAFACVIVNTVATLAGSYMLRPIINTFIAPPDGSPGNAAGLAKALVMLALVFIVGVIANYAQAKVMLTVAQNALQNCLGTCRDCRCAFTTPIPTATL